ncbi:hypothetical protein BH11MYX1_BH11MYX1_53450 [soil metagenome]
MVTSPLLLIRTVDPRVPIAQLGAGPDVHAILAQCGTELVEVLRTSFVAGSPRWHALEARLRKAVAISHPAVRQLLAIDAAEDTIVLEGDRDPMLAELLVQPSCELDRVARILMGLAHALAAMHRAGLAHAQLQPWAVRVAPGDRARIELTGMRARSPDHPWLVRCQAPELEAGGTPDAASDVYALGALLELFAGTREPPPALRELIDQMLLADPDQRPPAAEVARRLDLRTRPSRPTLEELDPEVVRAPRPGPGLRIGRFELARQLGVGASGEVWSAHDLADGPDVAIKLLKPEIAANPELLRRFRKEARVLGLVGSPYIANIIDLNEDRGLHYLLLELVRGGTVASALTKLGRFSPMLALGIIADACHALEEPHRQGIVHRDVKPENLMFVREGLELETAPTAQLVKLGDFGIARLVDATPHGHTRDGQLLGTPEYMAPEQCSNAGVTPATDVYALASSLFTMIAGRPPFQAKGKGQIALIMEIVSDTPPTLHSLVPEVAPAISELVARCLQKEPSARPQDATELLAAIDQVKFGSTAIVRPHPSPPVVKPGWIQTYAFEWDLVCSPEQLWPYISNTEKMNRAAGLAAVKFEITAERTIGRQTVAGLALRWHELPFEWVEGSRHTVLRVFDEGVLRWYTAEVTLERLPNGGTRLRNVVKLEPRRLVARIASKWQVGVAYKRKLGQVYRRLDAVLAAGPPPGVDPIAPEVVLATDARARLDKGRLELVAATDERAADAVIDYLARASDADVARIRPLELAQTFGVAEDTVVDAALHATRLGLVEMVWDVICPSCKIPSNVVDSLAKIEEHANCKACNLDYQVDFSRAIELAFRAAPAIREVSTETFCVGGPGNFPHVVAQLRLQPSERFVLPLALPPGYYLVRSAQLAGEHEIRVVASGGVRRVDITLGQPGELPALAAGDQLLTFASTEGRELVVRIERAGDRAFALTAARVMATSTFRELFPDQQLAPGRLMAITQTTLVVAQLHDAAALFKQLGDAKAFPVASQFFELVAELAKEHGGTIVKTFGGMVITAFDRPTAAIEAALALQARVSAHPRTEHLQCGVALHRGPMMALTHAGRLDYFGQNVERVIEVLPKVPAGAIGLTEVACRDVGIAERLANRTERLGLDVLPDGGWIQHVRSRATT